MIEPKELAARRELRWLLANRTDLSAANIDQLLNRFEAEAGLRFARKWEQEASLIESSDAPAAEALRTCARDLRSLLRDSGQKP